MAGNVDSANVQRRCRRLLYEALRQQTINITLWS